MAGSAAPAALPAAPPPVSLVPLETTPQIYQIIEDFEVIALEGDPSAPPIPQKDQWDNATALARLDREESSAWIHSGWSRDRHLVAEALARTAVPYNRLYSFCTCGGGASVMQNEETGELALRAHYCHDRFCQVCASAKARDYAARCATVFAGSKPLFITLTIGDTSKGLLDATNRLIEGFQTLRRCKFWQRSVSGGIALLEIKYNADRNRWHPHLHILCHGQYMEQAWLSDKWRALTGDAFRVDIRRVNDLPHAVNYVAKYASKPLNMTYCHDDALLDEAILALKGRRLVTPFGTCYKAFSDLEDEHDDRSWDEGWRTLGSFAALAAAARAGVAAATEAYAALVKRWTRTPKDGIPAGPPEPTLFPP